MAIQYLNQQCEEYVLKKSSQILLTPPSSPSSPSSPTTITIASLLERQYQEYISSRSAPSSTVTLQWVTIYDKKTREWIPQIQKKRVASSTPLNGHSTTKTWGGEKNHVFGLGRTDAHLGSIVWFPNIEQNKRMDCCATKCNWHHQIDNDTLDREDGVTTRALGHPAIIINKTEAVNPETGISEPLAYVCLMSGNKYWKDNVVDPPCIDSTRAGMYNQLELETTGTMGKTTYLQVQHVYAVFFSRLVNLGKGPATFQNRVTKASFDTLVARVGEYRELDNGKPCMAKWIDTAVLQKKSAPAYKSRSSSPCSTTSDDSNSSNSSKWSSSSSDNWRAKSACPWVAQTQGEVQPKKDFMAKSSWR